MPIAEKIAALFVVLTREEVDATPPAQRERFGIEPGNSAGALSTAVRLPGNEGHVGDLVDLPGFVATLQKVKEVTDSGRAPMALSFRKPQLPRLYMSTSADYLVFFPASTLRACF